MIFLNNQKVSFLLAIICHSQIILNVDYSVWQINVFPSNHDHSNREVYLLIDEKYKNKERRKALAEVKEKGSFFVR